MGNVLQTTSNGAKLFPEELTKEMFNLVRGKSSLTKLSASKPVPFSGEKMWTFNLDKEVDIVAESGTKSNGGATVGQVVVSPVKVEYGTRISDEFMYAANDVQLDTLKNFAEGFAKKVARGIDIMAFHGVNPRTGLAAVSTIGNNHIDAKVSQAVSYVAASANDNVSAAIGLIDGSEQEVTGMAMSPAFRSALADIKKASNSNEPLFPELTWGACPDSINGLKVDANSTVSFGTSLDMAIIGNFRDCFRWGYAKQIPIEIIQYGNPDNDSEAGDLKGHNQIYLRGEAYVGWGILIPEAFARIVKQNNSGSVAPIGG